MEKKEINKSVYSMVTNYAEKALNQTHYKDPLDYLAYIAYAGVFAQEGLPHEMSDIKKIVETQYNKFYQTKKGKDLIDGHAIKEYKEEVLKDSSKLEKFLEVLENKKVLNDLLESYISQGNLEVVKKLMDSPLKPSQKIKTDALDLCLLAAKSEQIEVLDYLFKKDKYLNAPKSRQIYLGIMASRSMVKEIKVLDQVIQEGRKDDNTKVLDYALKEGMDINEAGLLRNAVFYKHKYNYEMLINKGAIPPDYDPRTDEEQIKIVQDLYDKKLLHDNLNKDLDIRQDKSKAKI